MKLKRYRKDYPTSYTFGVFPTLELLAHQPDSLRQVITHSRGNSNAGVAKLWEACSAAGIPIALDDGVFERIGARENDYAIGVFEKDRRPLDTDSNHVVLVNPSDRGNLGTIQRTMLGFGLRDLAIITPAADIFDPRCVRASMGALFQMRIAEFEDFDAYAGQYVRHLYPFMTDGAHALADTTFESPFTLVFGSESAGLDESFLDVGSSVRIPQSGLIDSLNLAVSVGIGLYAAAHNGTF